MKLSPEKKKIFTERLEQACIARNNGKKFGIAKQLADDMDVTLQTAAKWLRGEMMPSSDRWGELAQKIGVPLEWLLGKTHEQPSTVKSLDEESLGYAVQAHRILTRLIVRIKPEAEEEEVTRLFEHAYHQLRSGVSEESVAGEIAYSLTK